MAPDGQKLIGLEYEGPGYEIMRNHIVSADYHTAICLSAFYCKIIRAMAWVSLRIRKLSGEEVINTMVPSNTTIRHWEDEVGKICDFSLSCQLVADDEILQSGDRISQILSCQTNSNIVNKRCK